MWNTKNGRDKGLMKKQCVWERERERERCTFAKTKSNFCLTFDITEVLGGQIELIPNLKVKDSNPFILHC